MKMTHKQSQGGVRPFIKDLWFFVKFAVRHNFKKPKKSKWMTKNEEWW
jgi:hypothetical protein